MCVGFHVKYFLLLPNLKQTWIFLTDFSKTSKYKIYWKSAQQGQEPSSGMWTDRHEEAHGHISQLCKSITKPIKKFSSSQFHPHDTGMCLRGLPVWLLVFQSANQHTFSFSPTWCHHPHHWAAHLSATWLTRCWLLAAESSSLVWTLASRVATRCCDLPQNWCRPLWHCSVQMLSHPSGPFSSTLSLYCSGSHSRCVVSHSVSRYISGNPIVLTKRHRFSECLAYEPLTTETREWCFCGERPATLLEPWHAQNCS